MNNVNCIEDLTKEQENFFKNSKVRDKSGNLLICYHGTPNPGFKEFNPKDNKSQFGKYKFDKYNVNYFTTDKKAATSFTDLGVDDGNNVYACYVNIENPFIVDNKTESQMRSSFNIRDSRVRDKEISVFNYIFKRWKNRYIRKDSIDFDELNQDLAKLNLKLVPSSEDEDEIYFDLMYLGNNGFHGNERPIEYGYEIDELFSDDMYDQLKEDIIGLDDDDYFFSTDDVVRYVLIMNEEDGTNYDGIIVEDIYDSKSMFGENATDIITLKSSNQIKLINNENPTLSNRIDEENIVESVDNDYPPHTLTKEQDEFFKDSKIRNKKGELVVCYHSTNSDFDTFKNSKIGLNGNLFGKGFYFSTHSDNIYSYGSKYKEVYLNIVNPFYFRKFNNESNELELAKTLIDNYLGEGSFNQDEFDNMFNPLGVEYQIQDYIKSKLGRYVDLSELLKKSNYDGIVVDEDDIESRYTEIVAFYPEQIKNIKNMMPTNSENINENLDIVLTEATRSQLLTKGKNGAAYKDQSKGRNRYERRNHSKIATSVGQYNRIDMDSFFKRDILTVGIEVQGETNNYIVTMKFSGVLAELRKEVERNNNKFEYKTIIVALTRIFNSGDVYVHCSCPDWLYSGNAYWATVRGYNAGTPQTNNGKGIVNPGDTKGSGCKHIMLVLANLNWLMKVASVINNYVHYCETRMWRNYQTYIEPAIYGTQQTSLFKPTTKTLGTSQQTLSRANKVGAVSGRFKKGNVPANKGIKKNPHSIEDDNLLGLDFEDTENSENSTPKFTGNNPSIVNLYKNNK